MPDQTLTNFAKWLQNELNKREWTQGDLVRRIKIAGNKITRSQISHILNSDRQASGDVCVAIAYGLGLPREEVFRARGWLLREPEKVFEPEFDPRALGLAKKVSRLPFESREVTLNVMETVLESTYQLTQVRESATEYNTS